MRFARTPKRSRGARFEWGGARDPVAYLLGLARGGETVGGVVGGPLEAAVQVLGGEVFGAELLPGPAPAALRVDAVPAALLVAWQQEVRGGMRFFGWVSASFRIPVKGI